jgi:hypothetical protein
MAIETGAYVLAGFAWHLANEWIAGDVLARECSRLMKGYSLVDGPIGGITHYTSPHSVGLRTAVLPTMEVALHVSIEVVFGGLCQLAIIVDVKPAV